MSPNKQISRTGLNVCLPVGFEWSMESKTPGGQRLRRRRQPGLPDALLAPPNRRSVDSAGWKEEQ